MAPPLSMLLLSRRDGYAIISFMLRAA